MSLRHAILGILEFSPAHGYQLRRVLAEGISLFWPVKLAAIYPCLRRLEEEGLVAHRTETTDPGRPDRKVYEITDSGRDELARWRRLPPEGEAQQRAPLYLKLLFAKPENLDDTVHWIAKDLERLRGQADRLRTELANPRVFSTFFLQFMRESGLAHLELQIEMLEDLRQRVMDRLARRKERRPGPDR